MTDGSERSLEPGLSAQQVADRLGVAEKTIRRWIEAGKLPAERRGHAFSIRLADAARVHGESRSGRDADGTAAIQRELEQLRRLHAVLEGRYAEAKELIAELRDELREEQQKSAALGAGLVKAVA